MKHIKKFNESSDMELTKKELPTGSQRYIDLHNFMKWLIDTDLEKTKSFMELFINDDSDNTTLKTILMITKSFKSDPILGETRKRIVELLEGNLGRKLV